MASDESYMLAALIRSWGTLPPRNWAARLNHYGRTRYMKKHSCSRKLSERDMNLLNASGLIIIGGRA